MNNCASLISYYVFPSAALPLFFKGLFQITPNINMINYISGLLVFLLLDRTQFKSQRRKTSMAFPKRDESQVMSYQMCHSKRYFINNFFFLLLQLLRVLGAYLPLCCRGCQPLHRSQGPYSPVVIRTLTTYFRVYSFSFGCRILCVCVWEWEWVSVLSVIIAADTWDTHTHTRAHTRVLDRMHVCVCAHAQRDQTNTAAWWLITEHSLPSLAETVSVVITHAHRHASRVRNYLERRREI